MPEQTTDEMEQFANKMPGCFGMHVPGVPFANMLQSLIGEDKCKPLRDKHLCAACGAKKANLRVCARCNTVSYCGAACQRGHWKTHKPSCTTRKSRVLQMFVETAVLVETTGLECSTALVEAALDATHDHVEAAKIICIALMTTGIVGVVSDAEFCKTLGLLFSVKLTPEGLTRVAAADENVACKLAARREATAYMEAQKASDMEPVFQKCSAICAALIDVLPGILLHRYVEADGPHPNNRSLVEYTLRQAQRPHYKNVPTFLRLVDECVKNSKWIEPVVECAYTPEQLRCKYAVIEQLTYSAWLQHGRIFEGDDETPDDEVVEIGRMRENITFHVEFQGNPGLDVKEWLKQPGRWLEAKLDAPRKLFSVTELPVELEESSTGIHSLD